MTMARERSEAAATRAISAGDIALPYDFRQRITVLILTYNEAPNIDRTLEALAWAKRIVVIDSGSTDETVAIAAGHEHVEVHTRAFDSHAAQWNYGLDLVRANSDWILALDADYVLSPELCEELRNLRPVDAVNGYRVRFRYAIAGKPLRASLYPPVTALYRAQGARYIQDGHTQRIVVDGAIVDLQACVLHDDRKPLAHWLGSQIKYARLEAEHILAQPRTALRRVDRLRLMAWPMPLLILPYTLVAKRCLFDGWSGWTYALQRLMAETLLALEIIDRKGRRQ